MCSASREAGVRGDGAQRDHADRGATEHDAEPCEDAVGNFAGLLVHTEAEHREESADEHHHDGDDIVGVLVRVACADEHHDGRWDGGPEHQALAVRQLAGGHEAVGEDGETGDTDEDEEQAGHDVHEKLL